MSDKGDESENVDQRQKIGETTMNVGDSRLYGSRSSLLSDVCTDFLPVVYQAGVGSSLMAFTHPKDDKEFSHLDYEDYPILKTIQDNVIGHDLVISTPYGRRKLVYCDFTASGRQLGFIEDYIRNNVFPSYANTHSSTGHNAIQTTKYREEARSIIKNCVNATKEDVVIFTGSGSTSALHKFAWALKVNQKEIAEETVVLTGPYEHHSNIIPWREYGTEVVRIRYRSETGLIDLQDLENELKKWKMRKKQLLVCVSAASNVTGIVTDTDTVATIAHKHGAIVLFDYAAGGPYLKIDMNPSKLAYKDAVIVSPHKFVGGPGTPGLLIAKKWIFKNPVPDRVGGGTVNYVTREIHSYLGHLEEREEGGTPAITESIRAGLAFKLKQDVGEEVIAERDENLCSRAFSVWEQNPSIYILGHHASRRLPIFSFLTKHTESGKLVHHNFISTLLSDLFGIQARGGCACAGPYAADLLGMPEPMTKQYAWFLSEKTEKNNDSVPKISVQIMKPGFTRLNLAYFNEDEITEYVTSAVDMVTKHGWKLLPQYTFEIATGSWKHRDFANKKESQLKSLEEATIFSHHKTYQQTNQTEKNTADAPTLNEVLARAEYIFSEAEEVARWRRTSPETDELSKVIPQDMAHLVWFLTPPEAVHFLLDRNQALTKQKYVLPFNLVNPLRRIIPQPQYDSDYQSAGSLRSSSDGSVSSEVYSYSKVNDTEEKENGDHNQNKVMPSTHKLTHGTSKISDQTNKQHNKTDPLKRNHLQVKSEMSQPVPQYLPITNRRAVLLPNGYPVTKTNGYHLVKDPRLQQDLRTRGNVPFGRREKGVHTDRQQMDNRFMQSHGPAIAQSKVTKPASIYHVKLI